jgi:hypothetical protein
MEIETNDIEKKKSNKKKTKKKKLDSEKENISVVSWKKINNIICNDLRQIRQNPLNTKNYRL